MLTIFDRYIGRTIFSAIMVTLFTLVSLSAIFKFVDQLRKVRGNYDALAAGWYTFLSIPKDIEIFFPLAALLGALLGLGVLASRSELVVMEASGFTRLQIAGAVMKTAIPLVLLTMLIGEWVAPAGEQMARNMRAEKMYGRSLIATHSGIWAKEGDDIIYIANIDNDNNLVDVTVYHFNEDNRLEYIRHASYATFNADDNMWNLVQVEESNLSDPKQVVGYNLFNMPWRSSLTPDKLNIVAMNPEALSASGLYDYVNYLKATGQESNRYELIFWGKVFKPLSVAVMMVLALSFIFGSHRSVPIGQRIVIGITFGFIFYLLDKMCGQFSIVYDIPTVVGAVAPSLIFLAFTVYWLKRRR